MVERSSKFLLIVVGSVCFMLILYQYVAPGVINFGSPHGYFTEEDEGDIFPTPDPHYVKKYYFPVRDLERTIDFQIKGEDVIVFLHIQKTGGTTFGRHLVQNVRLEVPCDCRPGQKKCTCYRPNRKETWLFSRFSTGWSCGLHADWTELTNCVPGVLNKKENKQKNLRGMTMSGRLLCFPWLLKLGIRAAGWAELGWVGRGERGTLRGFGSALIRYEGKGEGKHKGATDKGGGYGGDEESYEEEDEMNVGQEESCQGMIEKIKVEAKRHKGWCRSQIAKKFLVAAPRFPTNVRPTPPPRSLFKALRGFQRAIKRERAIQRCAKREGGDGDLALTDEDLEEEDKSKLGLTPLLPPLLPFSPVFTCPYVLLCFPCFRFFLLLPVNRKDEGIRGDRQEHVMQGGSEAASHASCSLVAIDLQSCSQ
ncbi:hypothetical protein FQN60_008760 [Etheostoma spectabile]|uniref:Heparan-sulfate 6-O-sulfotransferase n=1 Tax=Etheostoma spectabile TaxID=54343 RepID=A0A5J5CNS6_9PERO|nr:hypothetical protein FQN60_008760 [Etheostoma spectabile]